MTIITVKNNQMLILPYYKLVSLWRTPRVPCSQVLCTFFFTCFNLGTFVCYNCKTFFLDIVNHSSVTLITLIYMSDVFVSHILTSCKVISFQEKWLPNSVQNIYIHRFSSLIIFLETQLLQYEEHILGIILYLNYFLFFLELRHSYILYWGVP